MGHTEDKKPILGFSRMTVIIYLHLKLYHFDLFVHEKGKDLTPDRRRFYTIYIPCILL